MKSHLVLIQLKFTYAMSVIHIRGININFFEKKIKIDLQNEALIPDDVSPVKCRRAFRARAFERDKFVGL